MREAGRIAGPTCWLVSLVIMLAYLTPYFLLGEDASLRIHDNLDSNFVWYKVLLDSGALFSGNAFPVAQLFNGLPRVALPSEFDAFVWLYAGFGPWGAYLVNRILMTVVGFIGMYLLLKRHVVPGESNRVLHFGVALCFALLPFWPFGGLSLAGMPLMVCSLLNIRRREFFWCDWAILLVYPFYSSLVLSGFFLLLPAAFLWLVDVLRRRSTAGYFSALVLLSAAYVFSHYRLFLDLWSGGAFVSHRVEFASMKGTNFMAALGYAKSLFIRGQEHALSLQRYIVLPMVVLGSWFVLCKGDRATKRMFVWVLAGLVVSSFWYGFLKWDGIAGAKQLITRILPIQMDRFYFLHPVLWMVLFALVLSVILAKSGKFKSFVVMLLVLQLGYAASRHELLVNRDQPSVAAFFAKRQFQAVADFIGRDKSRYRVASLGLHPAIAQYNGFYTLDGYQANYPLAYKKRFREIIAGELARDEGLKNYFDHWGSRVYLFSTELKRGGNYVMNRSGNDFTVSRLDFDFRAFWALGGRYIFSAVHIDETVNPALKLEHSFHDPLSAWDVYLYRVSEPDA